MKLQDSKVSHLEIKPKSLSLSLLGLGVEGGMCIMIESAFPEAQSPTYSLQFLLDTRCTPTGEASLPLLYR